MSSISSSRSSSEQNAKEYLLENEGDNEVSHRKYKSIRHQVIKGAVSAVYNVLIFILIILVFIDILSNYHLGGKASDSEEGVARQIIHPDEEIRSEYGVDIQYMSLSHDYDILWKDLMAQRNVMVYYSDDRANGEQRFGAITLFHQLHCLAALRFALQAAYDGNPVAFDHTEDEHWPHCLDYLRKSLLCYADGTIEHEVMINSTRTGVVDGTRDVRTCKKTDPLYDYLHLHRINESDLADPGPEHN